MVRYGSKPFREISKEPALLVKVLERLRSFEAAAAYPPHQAFIGNLYPDDLWHIETPWYRNPPSNGHRRGLFGEIMPEEEFYGVMKICDDFDLLLLEEGIVKEVALLLERHPLLSSQDIRRLGSGVPQSRIEEKVHEEKALPLYDQRNRLVGCLQRGHEEDQSLIPEVLIENLAARASGVMALRFMLHGLATVPQIEYLLGCGEEAVGDRYNRGGGSLSKAIGELCGCTAATGSDVKAFCCAPIHAIVLAGSLVAAGIFKNVVVVGGGSFAKLGMKFRGHLRHDMPILEDVLAAVAILVGRDDGVSPVIRLDSIGKHDVGSGSSQQAIIEKLVVEPLDRLGLKLAQVNKYATEMHNPEITEPAGSGNVPRTNYRTIGSFAVLRGEMERGDLDHFIKVHGMPGFSPTQGHIASAIPFLGHALTKIRAGQMANAMFLAKGSLFLGRMTQLSDGMSFLLERNSGDG
ncbi:MAG: glycine reductase [Chloroflexi bacterium]|nr:glycine reductase [Chloroflexota bacterium]